MDKIEKIFQARRSKLKGIQAALVKPIDISSLAALVHTYSKTQGGNSFKARFAIELANTLLELVDGEIRKDARLLAPTANSARTLNIACLENPGKPVQLKPKFDYGLAETKPRG